jgi:hypothetical protein
MTWPFVNYGALGEASYGSDMSLVVWTLAWDNHALLAQIPLFDSNLFYPAADSLRYNEHLFGLSLFTLPWSILGASPVLAHNITWWLAFPFNGLAAFALVRRFVTSDLAAFGGSLVYTYSFYVMLHAGGHLHLIWLWPLPLSLLLLERWFDVPSVGRAALWAGTVLLQSMTSWYLAVMIILINALMGAVLMIFPSSERRATAVENQDLRRIWARRAMHLISAGVVMTLCLYPFARPYADITSVPEEISANAADLASYLVPPQNTIVGRWWFNSVNDSPRWIFGEQTLFVGWLALLLAAVGFVQLVRRENAWSRRAWIFPALGITGLVISFGQSLPLIGTTSLAPFNWLAALPGLDGLRAPARFAVVTMLGVSGLAAIAIDSIEQQIKTCGRLLIATVVPLMLLEWFVVDFPAGKPMAQQVPAIYSTPEVQNARALVSLPDYRGTDEWFRGADYLYFSTSHWRPIVNGFGRTAPPGYEAILDIVRAFPGSVPAIGALGIQYVIVHGDRFDDGAKPMLAAAQNRSDSRLIAQIGNDYLFEIVKP